MHELALEGIFTQMLYLHLRNADGEILSKFNVSYQSGLSKLMRDINFSLLIATIASCLPPSFRYNSMKNLFLQYIRWY